MSTVYILLKTTTFFDQTQFFTVNKKYVTDEKSFLLGNIC